MAISKSMARRIEMMEQRPAVVDAPTAFPRGHCHDAEKCNADTFCDCPCRKCIRSKRGEYEAR